LLRFLESLRKEGMDMLFKTKGVRCKGVRGVRCPEENLHLFSLKTSRVMDIRGIIDIYFLLYLLYLIPYTF
jgi:hypothetical protein